MANDPIPTTDQQVANRTGQTAPVPLPAALQPSTKGVSQFGEHQDLPAAFNGWDKLFAKQGQEPAGWKNLVSESGHVPMLTPDGSQSGDVPLHRAKEARASGFHLAVPMVAPNRQPGWVPYHRISDAIASGFQHVSDATANAAEELSNLTNISKGAFDAGIAAIRQGRSNLAEVVNDAVTKRIPNYDTMPPEVQNDLKELVSQGLGFYSAGLLPRGPSKTSNTIEQPLTSTVPPVGLGGGETPPEGQRIPKPTIGGEPIRVPPERTTGKFDAAIKEAKAVPGGIQKGDPEIDLPDLAYFHDPATGSTLALPTNQVTPENVRAQMRQSRAAYLKAKPEESEIVQPGHPLHIPEEPELKGIAKLDAPLDAEHANSKPIEYPRDKKFTNNTAAGMILPDGRIINARSAHIDTAKAAGFDNIDDFLKDSGAIRVIYGQGYGGGGNIGLEMHQPPTDAQIEVAAHNIQRAKKAGVGDGGVIWDFVSPDGKYQSGHGSIGAFQRDVEQWKASQTPEHWGATSDLLADRPDGGAVDPKTGKEDSKGFGIEVYPEARQRLDHAPTPDDLKSYYEANKDIFDKHPDLRLGWYQDPEKGWELNIGANTQSREGAEWAARKLDQKGIYDIEKGTVIPTGGQNEKTSFGRYDLNKRMADVSGESFKEMQKGFPTQAETRSMIRAEGKIKP